MDRYYSCHSNKSCPVPAIALQVSTYSEQHISLQARRVATLLDQLDKANAQVTQLSISLKHTHAQESSHKWQRDALQRKLGICEGEIQALESKLSAAHMEAAGQWCNPAFLFWHPTRSIPLPFLRPT